MGERVRAVVFDMGNVLIGWDAVSAYKELLPDAGDLTEFFSELFPVIYKAVHDDPRPMGPCLAPLKESYPHATGLIEFYETEWARFITGVMDETVDLLEALHKEGVALYGLTNWPHQVWPPHAQLAAEHHASYAFLDLFSDIVVSGQVQMMKPNPDIYEYALKRWGLAPQETLFVDDLGENIDTAQALGMQGHQFVSARALKGELIRCGLLGADGA